MTVRELIKKLLDLQVDIDNATVTFKDGSMVVTNIASDESSGCYGISG